VGTKQGRLAREARAQMERHRAAVYDRDWRQCVARGLATPCGGGLTLQHRVNRGMGGSADVGDGPQWYVTMCAVHNGLLESDAAMAAVGRRHGWVLPHSVDAEDAVLYVPVDYPDGHYLLNAEGGRERVWAA